MGKRYRKRLAEMGRNARARAIAELRKRRRERSERRLVEIARGERRPRPYTRSALQGPARAHRKRRNKAARVSRRVNRRRAG